MKKGGGGYLKQHQREKEVKESEKWIEPRNEQICRYIIFSEGGKADELKKSFIHDPCCSVMHDAFRD